MEWPRISHNHHPYPKGNSFSSSSNKNDDDNDDGDYDDDENDDDDGGDYDDNDDDDGGDDDNDDFFFFYVLLTVNLSIFVLVINQLDAQSLFYNKSISCLYMFRAPCARNM